MPAIRKYQRKHSMVMLFFISALFLKIFVSRAQSIGNGSDGSPLISGIINIYTPVTEDLSICDKRIWVKNISGFYPGDLILIIQMQGAIIENSNTLTYGTITDFFNAGNFEFSFIDSTDENSIFVERPILFNYSTNGKVQVIRVPQYISPEIAGTLTCKPWDGEAGGILTFDATETIFFHSNINVSGRGFRGGITMNGTHSFSYSHDFLGESYNPDLYSLKGEGIAFNGIFPFTSGRGAPANGGGGGNIHTAGGGGGGNGGCGGNGGWGYPVDTLGNQFDSQGIGGHDLIIPTSEKKIFMGGGGGAGHEHFDNGTDGENGAGIVIITANSVSGNSKMIMANGNNSAGSGAYGDGTGGAGAGGSIFLSVNNFIDTILISAKGGDGGSSAMKGFGPGGGGGGGVLLLSSTLLPENIKILSLEGGTSGLAGGNYYGAENGCQGLIVNNFKINLNDFYDGVKAGFTFSPDFLSLQNPEITFINTSTGASNYYWSFGDGSSDNTKNPVHKFDMLKNYSISLLAEDSICRDNFNELIFAEFIPNIFTPNGDGINDYLNFSIRDTVIETEFFLFNRWGETLYFKKGNVNLHEIQWDGKFHGKNQPEGTYFFLLNYITPSGKKTMNGTVMLLR